MEHFVFYWMQLVTGLAEGIDLSSVLLDFLVLINRRVYAPPEIRFQGKATLEFGNIEQCTLKICCITKIIKVTF
jgi:hypothetical protein